MEGTAMRATSLITVAAALLAGCIGFPAVASAHCPQHVQIDCPHQHTIAKKRIVGYKMVRRPVYETVTIPASQPPAPMPQATPRQDCCAIDLAAVFVRCLIRDGRTLWQYRAVNGIVYNMTVDRRNPRDIIRLFPDRHVAWVAAS